MKLYFRSGTYDCYTVVWHQWWHIMQYDSLPERSNGAPTNHANGLCPPACIGEYCFWLCNLYCAGSKQQAFVVEVRSVSPIPLLLERMREHIRSFACEMMTHVLNGVSKNPNFTVQIVTVCVLALQCTNGRVERICCMICCSACTLAVLAYDYWMWSATTAMLPWKRRFSARNVPARYGTPTYVMWGEDVGSWGNLQCAYSLGVLLSQTVHAWREDVSQ